MMKAVGCNKPLTTTTSTTTTTAAAAGRRFIDFVNRTGSPYHSVLASKRLLLNKGFIPLSEKKSWSSIIQPGGKYFIARNHSEIFAFIVGNKFNTDAMSNNASNAAAAGGGGSRIIMIGAHTDSPCLRLRPRSPIKPKEGIIQLGVSTYGGGLWHTWFDRGLGMAGKVVIHNNKGCIEERLIRVDRPVAIIPNLAIHLQTAEERNAGFKINPEEHLMPIFCSSKYYHQQQQQQQQQQAAASAGGQDDKQNTDDDAMVNGNHRALMELLAKEAGCSINDIIDFDVCMMDATPSSIIGVYDEFISSPRIDNLLSTWACMEALSSQSDHLIDGKDIYIAAAFDHEECGSTSYTGANSMTLQSWIKRILSSLDQQSHADTKYFSQIIAR
ncbi:hypothetical protein FOZ60_008106 [Perkinsus olseni]|nr:hypothetical protein FOZ60_008106 [Perkinsus olseni]KAF4684225.1 hypothetical protein FOZ60_008106 [Perkinsus olseni]